MFDGWYPKQMLTSKSRALPLPLTRHPPPGRGLFLPPFLGMKILKSGRIRVAKGNRRHLRIHKGLFAMFAPNTVGGIPYAPAPT